MPSLTDIGRSLGEGISQMGSYSAQAAAQANGVSAAAQAAQGAFNQQSADIANNQNIANMANQYAFNSAQAAEANAFTEGMWQKTADWNERMWEKQAAFNAEQAQIQRDWQTQMSNTQYQRAVKDMSSAGLNPILAVTGGGVGTNVPGGATASVGGASMSSAQGAMASGGLIGANSASEGNYQGQMEYLAGNLGLISMALSGISTAAEAFGSLGDIGESIAKNIDGLFNFGKEKVQETKESFKPKNLLNNAKEALKDTFKGDSKKTNNKVGGGSHSF